MESGRIGGDIVVVTGGASGIGAATAKILAGKGYRVVSLDIRQADELSRRDGVLYWPKPADVCDADAIADIFSTIESEMGPIEGIVNAAGILGRMRRPEEIDLEHWNRELAVDLTGTFIVAREGGGRMAARGRGSIVNIASVAGMTGAPTHAYSAAKAGVISLTRTLAASWGPKNVRVNAVSPGFTLTEALQAAFDRHVLDADRLKRAAALRRLVDPVEVAEAAAWLISPLSSGVTGINIPVDAGFLTGVANGVY